MLTDACDAWPAGPTGYHTLGPAGRDQVEMLGRRVLDEQQLTVAYGPLRGQAASRGPR